MATYSWIPGINTWASLGGAICLPHLPKQPTILMARELLYWAKLCLHVVSIHWSWLCPLKPHSPSDSWRSFDPLCPGQNYLFRSLIRHSSKFLLSWLAFCGYVWFINIFFESVVCSDQARIDRTFFSGSKHWILISKAQGYSLLKFLSSPILPKNMFTWTILIQLNFIWNAGFYK